MELGLDGKWHWSEAEKQKKRETNKNLVWITDETESWRILKTDPIPEGWKLGRLEIDKRGLVKGATENNHSPEANRKRSEAIKGRVSPNKGNIPPNKGLTDVEFYGEEKASEIAKKKSVSLFLLGKERSIQPRDRTVWSRVIKERDKDTCQHCGEVVTGIKLRAHHVKSWEDFLELRFVISNGISLCQKCHDILEFTIRVFRRNNITAKTMFVFDNKEVCSTCHRLTLPTTFPNVQTCTCQDLS